MGDETWGRCVADGRREARIYGCGSSLEFAAMISTPALCISDREYKDLLLCLLFVDRHPHHPQVISESELRVILVHGNSYDTSG